VWKFRLVRGLYEQGFQPEEVRRLLRLIDWLMELPQALDKLFWQELKTFEEERTVPFISLPERMGIREGLLQAIEDVLRVKFGEEGLKLLEEITALEDNVKFRAMIPAIVQAATLDEVRRACAEAAAPPPEPKKKRRGKRTSS
jgi:hypothetical protein